MKISVLMFLNTFFLSHFAQAEQVENLKENKHYVYQYQLAHTPKKATPKKSKRAKLKVLARQAAIKHGLSPKLFLALVTQESQWRPHVVSKRGATGLTQLMPKTAKGVCKLNRWELKDPKKNLDCGAKYLAQQIKRFGLVRKGVCAFNAGPTIVAKLGRCPRYKETQHYVRKIMMTLN